MKQLNITLLLTLLISMLGIKAAAHNIAVKNADGKYICYDYNNNRTELEVTYSGNSFDQYSNEYSGNVVIPESVTYKGKTYSVTSIDDCAFRGCSNLTSVIIPNSVTSIGEYAFYGCSSLTSISISNSVASIGGFAFHNTAWYNNQPDGLVYAGKVAYKYKGTMPSNTNFVLEDGTLGITDYAFYGCSGLTCITIPNSVTNIGSSAFGYCSLTSITIRNSVTTIGILAFGECSLTEVHISDLAAWCKIKFGSSFSYAPHHLYINEEEVKNLVIPNSVTNIGNYAFSGCSSLTSITIPNSVTNIGNYAFSGCSGLTNITIPNSVTNIGEGAFANCSGLTSITIPNSVHEIYGAFANCSGLKSVTIPNSVTTIGRSAFLCCSGLTSIIIPNSVTSIGEGAFSGCSCLTSITIPNSVISIGDCAFSDCRGLTSIIIPNSVTHIYDYAFANCSGLTSIIIPNSVTHIYNYAFSGCSGLTSIIIPNSVKYIRQHAFSDCPNLKDVYCYSGPTTFVDAFTGSNIENATLYVPDSAIEYFKATMPWSGFKDIKSIKSSGFFNILNSDMKRENAVSAVYDLQGRRVEQPQRGLYIRNGKKVIVR